MILIRLCSSTDWHFGITFCEQIQEDAEIGLEIQGQVLSIGFGIFEIGYLFK